MQRKVCKGAYEFAMWCNRCMDVIERALHKNIFDFFTLKAGCIAF